MMTTSHLRVVSYNCRGWISAVPFIDSIVGKFDLCFSQEHWLLNDQLSSLDFHPDFCSTATCCMSGMNSSDLIIGRPFGGCAILFRKSLIPAIIRLKSLSTRFCALYITPLLLSLFVFTYLLTTAILTRMIYFSRHLVN